MLRARALGAALLAALLAALPASAILAGACSPASASTVPAPHLPVTGAAMIDAASGQLLYGDAVDARLPIASTTKIMTALVTLDRVHRLGRVLAQNDWYPAPVDSQIGLVPGERMSVHDLLLAMLLPSADDAAEDLAYNLGGGSVSRFVAMMNAEAAALGLRHTHYTTPIGLDTPGNYSSPGDLVKLSAYVLAHSAFFRRAVSLPSAVLSTGRYRRVVVNLNDLVRRYRWINGVKTGHTLDAGYVLVASGTRHGLTLIDAVLGTPSEAARDSSALRLLEYGFAAFRQVDPVSAGEVLARRAVHDEPGRRAAVIATSGFERLLPRTDRVRVELKLPAQLTGPLPRGAIVGQATVLADGRPLARIPLALRRALPAVSPLTQAGRFLTRTPTLILLAAVFVAAVLGMARRRRPRGVGAGHLEEG
jgi:D-alanyl-D-alanine carboxypeptidase (penicillin-binding protein 5/6)